MFLKRSRLGAGAGSQGGQAEEKNDLSADGVLVGAIAIMISQAIKVMSIECTA